MTVDIGRTPPGDGGVPLTRPTDREAGPIPPMAKALAVGLLGGSMNGGGSTRLRRRP